MKIAFIAMSGIRACDEKLLELGLTLPGFVHRSEVIASLPSLGLLYLAAVTPQGHDIDYVEIDRPDLDNSDFSRYDLVAISSFTAQIREAYALADHIRAQGVLVAMGGLHVTVRPEEAAQHADYVAVGEGENVWPEIVRLAETGTGHGVFNARDFEPVNIERLPVPRYDLLQGRRYNRFTVQTSRGCPWRCDFCGSGIMLQRPYRKRPVERIVRDIEAVATISEHPFLEFADDNTFVDKRWGKDLCRAIAPMRLKWFTETDISVGDDPKLLTLMKEAGCRQVLIGLESPDAAALEGIEQRADFKSHRFARNAESIRRIQDHGITVNGCFVLGLDHHTPDTFARVLEYADENALYDVQITFMTPLPGTPLYDRLRREGRLIDEEAWEKCTLFDVNYQPSNMSPDELREGMYWLSGQLYSDEAIARRRRRYFKMWKAGTQAVA